LKITRSVNGRTVSRNELKNQIIPVKSVQSIMSRVKRRTDETQ
jgi:hypothetical protein